MIELLVVIVLLSILSVYALGSLFNQDQFAAKGFFDDARNAAQFAQKLAISTGCDVRFYTDDPATGYQLLQSSGCIDNDFTDPVANPANRGINYENFNLPSGYSLTLIPTNSFTFTARGVLDSGNDFTFTVSDPSTTLIFSVDGQTGLVW